MGVKNPLIYLFSDSAHEGVVCLPLFEILFMPVSVDLRNFDAIVFTSKNSVKALEYNAVFWKDKECYAIGEGTKEAIETAGGSVVFTCKESYGDSFAKQSVPMLLGKKVFFPRAKEVSSSLFDILRDAGIDITQHIVYETVCRKYTPDHAPQKNAILIFTSPSTVRCFHENFAWDESYHAVAIGKKTAAALPLHVKLSIPKTQTIGACIELAKQIRS